MQVFVRQGPNANQNFYGQVTVKNDLSATTEPGFVNAEAESYTISLEFNGRSVQFIIYTDRGNIFGTGMMENSQHNCTGTGGGILSGPAFGDLGDWRSEWVSESVTIMEEQTRTTTISPFWICLGALFIFIIIFIASLLIRALTPYKTTGGSNAGRSEKSKISNDTVKRIDRERKATTQGKDQALAEYQITYSANDQLFDLSFEINKSSRYAGDFGVLVAKTLNVKQGQATALEIWLFDARNAQTLSLILMSDFCNSQPDLRAEMEQKGKAELLQPGTVTNLNTNEIIVKTQVLQVEYEPNTSNANSVFKKVTLKIGAWDYSG
jgi:hypothetical protein